MSEISLNELSFFCVCTVFRMNGCQRISPVSRKPFKSPNYLSRNGFRWWNIWKNCINHRKLICLHGHRHHRRRRRQQSHRLQVADHLVPIVVAVVVSPTSHDPRYSSFWMISNRFMCKILRRLDLLNNAKQATTNLHTTWVDFFVVSV